MGLRNGFLSCELSSQPLSNFARFLQNKAGCAKWVCTPFQILHGISQGSFWVCEFFAALVNFSQSEVRFLDFRKPYEIFARCTKCFVFPPKKI